MRDPAAGSWRSTRRVGPVGACQTPPPAAWVSKRVLPHSVSDAGDAEVGVDLDGHLAAVRLRHVRLIRRAFGVDTIDRRARYRALRRHRHLGGGGGGGRGRLGLSACSPEERRSDCATAMVAPSIAPLISAFWAKFMDSVSLGVFASSNGSTTDPTLGDEHKDSGRRRQEAAKDLLGVRAEPAGRSAIPRASEPRPVGVRPGLLAAGGITDLEDLIAPACVPVRSMHRTQRTSFGLEDGLGSETSAGMATGCASWRGGAGW